ncbi:MFS transporter protein [Rutstroemia sp. NJR-2017a BVV2]|nr:MFS transporter protein [Rutstroemia sp. NJR-2017a BVV2]
MSYFPYSENMPGAFNLDHEATHLSGAKSNMFLPPETPSVSATSSLYLTRSTDMITAITGRKRNRVEPAQYPKDENEDDRELMTPGSPMPFVNTKYRLAGGLDTPQQELQNRDLRRDSDYGDIGYRKQLDEVKEDFEMDGNGADQLSRDENGRPRIRAKASEGWIKPVVDVVGGVVGKVWEFCTKGAFRGFQAGGGKAYTFGSSQPIENNPSQFNFATNGTTWDYEKSPERDGTPVPGGFPDVIEDYLDPDYKPREASPPRPAKRRQLSFVATPGQDEMSRNWVVIPTPQPEPQAQPSYPMLPPVPAGAFAAAPSQNAKPRLQQRSSIARYTMPTSSSANRRQYGNSNSNTSPSIPRPLSRAGSYSHIPPPRRPTLQSTPRVSQQNAPYTPTPAAASNPYINNNPSFSTPRQSPSHPTKHSPSPSVSSRIPRWTPNSPKLAAANMNESPAAKEARLWQAKKLQEEREADEAIRRLDNQLKAMIREGQEALGKKVDVEGAGGMDVDLDGGLGDADVFGGSTGRWGV